MFVSAGSSSVHVDGVDFIAARSGATQSRERIACTHSWHWRDWLFVGSARAMRPLALMADSGKLLSRIDTRCFGLCQEVRSDT